LILARPVGLIDVFHHRRGDFVGGAGAVRILVLKAVPLAGVVAGGDDDGPGGLLSDDAVAYHRGRCGSGGQVSLDAVSGDDLGRGGGEVTGSEAGIVADDQPPPAEPGLLEIAGDALGAVADVFEGEVLRDDGPPAVRAELDGIWFFYLPHPLHFSSVIASEAKQSLSFYSPPPLSYLFPPKPPQYQLNITNFYTHQHILKFIT